MIPSSDAASPRQLPYRWRAIELGKSTKCAAWSSAAGPPQLAGPKSGRKDRRPVEMSPAVDFTGAAKHSPSQTRRLGTAPHPSFTPFGTG